MNTSGRPRRKAVPHHRRPAGGFTLFELGVVAAVSAVISTLLLYQLWFYRQEAEQEAMRAVVTNLRTALRMRTAELYVRGRQDGLPTLMAQNPMDWLVQKPPNYRGEWPASAEARLEANAWYFNNIDKKLTYVLRGRKIFYQNHLSTISFHVELLRLPTYIARPSETPETINGVVLNQVTE